MRALLASALIVALVAGAYCQDGLDLPVEKPAKKVDPKGSPLPKEPPLPEAPTVQDDRPPTFYGKEVHSDEQTLVAVIDRSGSMGDDVDEYVDEHDLVRKGCRLDRAKVQLCKLVHSMTPNWKFNIYAYDCSTEQLAVGLVQADDAHKAEALTWINALTPGGGTATGPEVARALKEIPANKLLLLLTDGMPNCALGGACGGMPLCAEHLKCIEAANLQHAKIDVFGIGVPSVGEWRDFLDAVARDSGGTYSDVR